MASAEVDVSRALVAKYIDVASTSLVFYDWLTGFADEIELVWKAPSRSLPRYIFFLLRYSTLTVQPISLLYDFLLTASEHTCKNFIRAIVALTYVVLACTELIIMLRLFTTNRGNKFLYRSVWAIYLFTVIISAVVVAIWAHNLKMTIIVLLPTKPGLEPKNILPGCWSPEGGVGLFIPYGIIVCWEIAVTAASNWKTYKNHLKTRRSFWELFFADGNHFYAWVIVISFISVGLVGMFAKYKSTLLQGRIIFALTRTVHSVCVARLIFHVRRQGRIEDSTDSIKTVKDDSFDLDCTAMDEEKLTKSNRKGKRVRDAWEESRKLKDENSRIEIINESSSLDQSPELSPQTPSSSCDCHINAGRDMTDSTSGNSIPEENSIKERESVKKLHEWMTRVNASMSSL